MSLAFGPALRRHVTDTTQKWWVTCTRCGLYVPKRGHFCVDPNYTHDGIRRDKAIHPRSNK